MSSRFVVHVGGAVALAATTALATPEAAMAYETPPYTVLREDGKFEVRAYDSMIVAEVTIADAEGAAPNAAFGPLFSYISGRNTAQSKIAMTAPVTQAPADAGRDGGDDGVKIAMTAPVTQAPAQASDGEAWTVAFIMPSDWSMDTLPTPTNPDVRVREIPARTVASLRYSGRSRPKAQARKRAELQEWLDQNGYEPIDAPEVAFYNAPFVPGPFRRNEILVTIAPASFDAGETAATAE